MLIAEDRKDRFRALFRQWQVIHEDPDQGQRQYGRDGPEVADILQVQRRTVGGQQAGSKETGEIPAQEQGRCQVDDGYAQIADAGIDAERKALVFLRKEKYGRRKWLC